MIEQIGVAIEQGVVYTRLVFREQQQAYWIVRQKVQLVCFAHILGAHVVRYGLMTFVEQVVVLRPLQTAFKQIQYRRWHLLYGLVLLVQTESEPGRMHYVCVRL